MRLNYLNKINVFLPSECRYLQEVRLGLEDQGVLEDPRGPTIQTQVTLHNTHPAAVLKLLLTISYRQLVIQPANTHPTTSDS